VVIFGAAVRPDGSPSPTLRRRVEAALACGARTEAPLYVPTGARGRYGASEASVMARQLREAGVAPERILPEETGTDTLSSVRAVVRIVRDGGLSGPVHVATSGYHLPRCVMLLRLAGVAATACGAPPPAEGFWPRWYWRMREAAAIPYDALLLVWLRLMGRA
jgi:vancomycin permeability regulator SanA